MLAIKAFRYKYKNNDVNKGFQPCEHQSPAFGHRDWGSGLLGLLQPYDYNPPTFGNKDWRRCLRSLLQPHRSRGTGIYHKQTPEGTTDIFRDLWR